MKKNMGPSDRIIRVIAAIVIVLLYITNTLSGTIGVVLLVVAGIFVLTSLVGSCPLYALFRISTCSVKREAE